MTSTDPAEREACDLDQRREMGASNHCFLFFPGNKAQQTDEMDGGAGSRGSC